MRILTITSIFITSLFFGSQALADDHNGEAKRAIVTTAIESREPTDNLNDSNVTTDVTKVYFFTEIMYQANTSVTHRWFLDGKLEAEVVLKIGSNRWRTYSSKNLVPSYHKGNWQVEAVSEKGAVLGSTTFVYGE